MFNMIVKMLASTTKRRVCSDVFQTNIMRGGFSGRFPALSLCGCRFGDAGIK